MPSEPLDHRQHHAAGLPTLFGQIRDLTSPRGISFQNHKLTEQVLAPQNSSSTRYRSLSPRSAGQHSSWSDSVFKVTPPWSHENYTVSSNSQPAVSHNGLGPTPSENTSRPLQEPMSPPISSVVQEPQTAALAVPAAALDRHGVAEQCRETREQVENLSALMQLLKGDVDGIRRENWKLRTTMKQRLVSNSSQQSEESTEASQDARVPPLPSFLPRLGARSDSQYSSHANTPAKVLVTGRPSQDDHLKSSLPCFPSDVMNCQQQEYLNSQLDAERRFKNIQAAADAAAASAADAAAAAAQRDRITDEKSPNAATSSFAAVQHPMHAADRTAGDDAAEADAVRASSQGHGRPARANSNVSVSNLREDVPASGPETSAADGLRSTPRRGRGLIHEQLATQRAAEIQALRNQLADAELQKKKLKDAADTAVAAERQERIAAQKAEEAAKMAEAIAKHREQLAEERAREAAAEAAIAAAKTADQTVARGKTGQDERPVARSGRNSLGPSSYADMSISSPVSSRCSRFSTESHPVGALCQNQLPDQRAAEVQRLRRQLAEAECRNKELQAAADSAAAAAQREHMAAQSAQEAAKQAAATAQHHEQLADRRAREASAEAAALAMKIAEQSDPDNSGMSTFPQTRLPGSEAALSGGIDFRLHPDAEGFQSVPDLDRTRSGQKTVEQNPLCGQRLKQQLARAERKNRNLQAAAETAVADQQQRRTVAKKVQQAAKKAAAEAAAAAAARHAGQSAAETNDQQGAGPAISSAPPSLEPTDGSASAVSELGPVPLADTGLLSQQRTGDPKPGSSCLRSRAKTGAPAEQQKRMASKKDREAGKPVATTQRPHEHPADKRANDAAADAAMVARSTAEQNAAQSHSDPGDAQSVSWATSPFSGPFPYVANPNSTPSSRAGSGLPDPGDAQSVAWATTPFSGPFPYVANPNSTPASRAGSGLLWPAQPEKASSEAACPRSDQQLSAEQRVRLPFESDEKRNNVAGIAAQHSGKTADNRARDSAAEAAALASKNTKHAATQRTNGLGEVPTVPTEWEAQAFSGPFPCVEPPTSASASAVSSGFISAVNPDRPADLEGSLARIAELKFGSQNGGSDFQHPAIGLDKNPTNDQSHLPLDRYALPNNEQAFASDLNAHDRHGRGGERSNNHMPFLEVLSVEPVEPEEEIPCRSSPLRRSMVQVPDVRNGDCLFFASTTAAAGRGLGWRKLRRVFGAAAVFSRLLEDVREKQALGLYDRDWNRPGFGGSSRLMGARLPSQALGPGSRRLSRPGSQSLDAAGVQRPNKSCLKQGSGSLHGSRGVSKNQKGSQKLSAAGAHGASPCQSRRSISSLSEGNDSPTSSLRKNGSNAALGELIVVPQKPSPAAVSDSARGSPASSVNLEVVLKADEDDSKAVSLPKPTGSSTLPETVETASEGSGTAPATQHQTSHTRSHTDSHTHSDTRSHTHSHTSSKTRTQSKKQLPHKAGLRGSSRSAIIQKRKIKAPRNSDQQHHDVSSGDGEMRGTTEGRGASTRHFSGSTKGSLCLSSGLQVESSTDENDSKSASDPQCTTLVVPESPEASTTAIEIADQSNLPGSDSPTHAHGHSHSHLHTHSHSHHHTHSKTHSHTHSHTHSKSKSQSRLRPGIRSAILQPSQGNEDEANQSEDPQQESQQQSYRPATFARPRGEVVAAEAARVAARAASAAAAAGRLHGAALAKAAAMNGSRRVAMPWGGVGVGLPYSGCSWAEK